ncbi:MAG: hypothetical protein QOJ90_1187 [Actinomycetota bacterium]|jgi:predicted GNAT family N-acyltransferase|nr:hypothetical protein [Actinomycetota bacterium]
MGRVGEGVAVTVTDAPDARWQAELMDLYAGQWWAEQRAPNDVVTMLNHTDLFAVAQDSGTGKLVGFARVLTDYVYLAQILDVIVAESSRGQGIGAALMDALCGDERLASVHSMELVCQQELEPFYAHWGFTSRVGESRLMRRTNLGLPLASAEG